MVAQADLLATIAPLLQEWWRKLTCYLDSWWLQNLQY
jgi:hypothetical protein